MKINKLEAERLILNSRGRLFTVWFNKRADNSPRRITGRLGVSKFIKGGTRNAEHEDMLRRHQLITVAEFLSAQVFCGRQHNFGVQYRSIPIEKIRQLKINNQIYEVNN